MKKFLQHIFGTKKQDPQPDPWRLLAHVISDVGVWCNFITWLPDAVQLDFDRTMLYTPSQTEGTHPIHYVGLIFYEPSSIMILGTNDLESADELHTFFEHDDFGPFTLAPDNFTFNRAEVMDMLGTVGVYQVLFGKDYNDLSVPDDHVVFGFWNDDVGMLVTAKHMKIRKLDGVVHEIHEIPACHAQWMEYWRTYWQYRGTPQALPLDYLCEITIPVQ